MWAQKNPWGVDLGFRFFREHWGKGIATTAAQAALSLGRTFGATPIIGRTLSSNTASKKVLEKVGMVQYGTLPFEDFAQTYHLPESHSTQWADEQVLLYTFPD